MRLEKWQCFLGLLKTEVIIKALEQGESSACFFAPARQSALPSSASLSFGTMPAQPTGAFLITLLEGKLNQKRNDE
jgi:hypothetical protein